MRFAGDSLIQSGVDTALPGSNGQEVAIAPGIAAGMALIGGLSQLKRAEMGLDGGNLHHGEVRPSQPKKEPAGFPTGLGGIIHKLTR